MGSHEEDKEKRDGLKLQILQEQRTLLCEKLDPSRHYPYLQQERILSVDDKELIESERTRIRKVNTMLDILIRNGPQSFDALCQSLRKDKTQISTVLRPMDIAFETGWEEIKGVPDTTDCELLSEDALPIPSSR